MDSARCRFVIPSLQQGRGSTLQLRLAVALVAATALPLQPAIAAANPVSPPRAIAAADLGPSMLGTRAVPIAASRFNASLARARQDATALPALQRLVAPAHGLPPVQQLAYVQRAVHSLIQWRSDATEWGQHDYWATAAETLAHGAGDMEDRAIVKFQALRALGFRNSDLFLTMARDRVGGPITVVTARVGPDYYVLDDTGGTPYRASDRSWEFQPLLSFGLYGAWVHSRPVNVVSTTAVAAAATGR
jgi:predicted transglutaminase-like cysteine proteinase